MDAVRFAALLDAYGADPARWPEDERAAALALLAESADARARQHDAATLDAALDAAPPAQPSDLLLARVLAAAPGAPAPRAAMPAPRRRRAGVVWRYAAVAAPLAAAAAVALWLTAAPQPSAPLSEDVLAELSIYGTPGDALLDVTGVELLEGDAWSDCEAGGLGCLDDLDAAAFETHSETATERSFS
jgi:hypothetical protein